MEEVWKDIEGFEGKYQVSNLGNVKSLNYANRRYARNLVPKINNCGYLWVELWDNGKSKPFLIHRLVAKAFIKNENRCQIINHKDENPKNCNVDNLEWCDNSYNVLYSLRKRRSGSIRKTKHSRKKLLRISKDGVVTEISENIAKFCKNNDFNEWSILQCCKGNRKTAYGYKWEFAE